VEFVIRGSPFGFLAGADFCPLERGGPDELWSSVPPIVVALPTLLMGVELSCVSEDLAIIGSGAEAAFEASVGTFRAIFLLQKCQK
jgi:hypothetical protein